MTQAVYRTVEVLGQLCAALPIGTNLGLVHLGWLVLSGQLLSSRGAVIPGLQALGLPAGAVRRAWAALGQGRWTTAAVVARWRQVVELGGAWQARVHGGYTALAADVTHFVRPRLMRGGQRQYLPGLKQTVPVIPVGIVARVGQVGTQRLGLPLALVRATGEAASREAHVRAVVAAVVAQQGPTDVGVFDRGFVLTVLQAAGCSRYVVRLLKNFTARRATLPPPPGRGRPRTRGDLVRPLARTRQGRTYPATPPDRSETWTHEGRTCRADWWDDLVLPNAAPDALRFAVVAIHDPRYPEPLLLATDLPLTGAVAQALYADRWPVEHLPLVAKQLLGAHRQFVHAPETCQRLPELTLLLGSVLAYLAATHPPVPTGFWDRCPQPTPGRFRRLLARHGFPQTVPSPARLRPKAAVTAHLPTGVRGHRRQGATHATRSVA